MSRYIDADALIADLDKGLWGKDWDKALAEAIINNAPTIEQKRGEWVNARDGVSDHVKCTNCFRTYYLGIVENYNFCPNCGARMKGADDEYR